MTRAEAAQVLKDLQDIEDRIREQAQKEYAHDEENAFANFERVAERIACRECGAKITREQVLMVYLLKHVDGIIAHINGHEVQREGIEGRIVDTRVYEALLAGMFREKDENWQRVLRDKHRELKKGVDQ